MEQTEQIKYPYGKFEYGLDYTQAETDKHIIEIAELPSRLEEIIVNMSSEQMNKSYREGGWTARQIIHHLADSHMNAFIRMKLSLTENNPVIKPYNQDSWATLADVQVDPQVSIQLLKALHVRWQVLLQNITPQQLNRSYHHPEYKKDFSLQEFIALYAWHGRQHCGHLRIIMNGSV
jgi:hypothetical protein